MDSKKSYLGSVMSISEIVLHKISKAQVHHFNKFVAEEKLI